MAWVPWLGYLDLGRSWKYLEYSIKSTNFLLFPPSFEEIIEISIMSVAKLAKGPSECTNQGNNQNFPKFHVDQQT